MARISTYPIDEHLVSDDKWIGSSANSKLATKNFSLESVTDWMNNTSSIDSQTLRYKFQSNAYDSTRDRGSISMSPTVIGDVPFASVTGWTISAYSLKYVGQNLPTDISRFYTSPLVDSYIIITNSKDISNFGIFLWNTADLRPLTTDFWDIGLTHVTSSGDLSEDEDYFMSLLTYNAKASADKTFIFTQSTPSESWVVNHNLNKFPSVSIVDSSNEQVMGSVEYIDLNSLIITFSSSFSGKAFLN